MKTPAPPFLLRMRLKPLVAALAASAGLSATSLAHAQSNQELLNELQALKQRIQQLEDKLQQNAVAPPQSPASAEPAVSVQDFNRVSMKVEAAEDAQDTLGWKGLKISGMMDPTFVYNNRADTAGFNFLNNFNGTASAGDGYTYYNSYFGMAMLDFQKETEGGQKWRLTLAPHKSASSGYNTGSIVHEASVSVPLDGPANKLIAGQIPDWSGYEYIWSNLQPLISHNLLFDFTIPSYYAGAGMEMTRGKWVSKFLVANINKTTLTAADKTPGLTFRADYTANEFSGFGLAGTAAQTSGASGATGGFNMLEVDGFYMRGDLTLQGQIGAGQLVRGAFNGGTANWSGLSALAAYKVTPRLQWVARADYINNKRNGGGVFGSTATTDPNDSTVNVGDIYNGFGPAMTNSSGTWAVENSDSGVNRYALSVGLNYLITPNHTANSGIWNTGTWYKLELRADGADGLVFYDAASGGYKRDSLTVLSSLVFAF
jgi:hypothetical protein